MEKSAACLATEKGGPRMRSDLGDHAGLLRYLLPE